MSQKDVIVDLLTKNKVMTQSDFSIEMYGDNKHLPNVYASLMSLVKSGIVVRTGDRPSYYSLSNADLSDLMKFHKNESERIVHKKSKISIPTPSNEQVEYWLRTWDSLPDYTVQEEAINELFQGQYKSNQSLKNIIIKCSVLNDFYSTNIFKVYPVACHILKLDIDERLNKGDISIVNEIANNKIANKEKNFYSFASKYCSHHNQDDYPIYDSYVDQMLRHFRNADGFTYFYNDDLKDYKKFKDILLEFKKYYKLDEYSLKDLDKYLWQAGKKYYPKKYKKKSR